MNTEPSTPASDSPQRKSSLIFVDNADAGLMAALFDSAHKLLSPATYDCQLCALTHGLAGPREQWSAFLKTLDVPLEFLHRDEFRRRFARLAGSTALPAIFRERDGTLEPVIDGTVLRGMTDLDALIEFVRGKASGAQSSLPE